MVRAKAHEPHGRAAEASSPAFIDRRQITLLYNRQIRNEASPVVELNRAVAIAVCVEGSAPIEDYIGLGWEHRHLAEPARKRDTTYDGVYHYALRFWTRATLAWRA
jgi:hypothetical protein